MCQSTAKGGRRCYDHGAGAAARKAVFGYAQTVTDLDDPQIASIYSRIKRDGKRLGCDKPSAQETAAFLSSMRRNIAENPHLDDTDRDRLLRHLDQALVDTADGNGPDGATMYAWRHTSVEAEVADMNLGRTLGASARHRHLSPSRVAAQFDDWRARSNYEDMESPDPTFRPSNSALPSDKHSARALRKLGFENYLAQAKPVFVYGTLRSGQGNNRLVAPDGTTSVVNGKIAGIGIYGADAGFPYAKDEPGSDSVTVGEMVELTDDENGRSVRFNLDRLEGFSSDNYSNSHYYRTLKDVSYVDPATGQPTSKQAWVYLAGGWAAEGLKPANRIADGDWVKARAARYVAPIKARYSTYKGFDADGYDYDDKTPSRSARDSAAAFGLVEDDEMDEHAAFWAANDSND